MMEEGSNNIVMMEPVSMMKKTLLPNIVDIDNNSSSRPDNADSVEEKTSLREDEEEVADSTSSSPLHSNTTKRRLDFTLLQDCGIRQREIQILLKYATTVNPSKKKPAIWIEAEAGVGKSWLLQQFRDQLELLQTSSSKAQQTTATATSGTSTALSVGATASVTSSSSASSAAARTPSASAGGGTSSSAAAAAAAASSAATNVGCIGGAVTIYGKFEERTAASEPFAALRDAVAELVQYILHSISSSHDGDDKVLRRRRQHQEEEWIKGLEDAIGITELPLLLNILPSLRPIFETSDTTTTTVRRERQQSLESIGSKEKEFEGVAGDVFDTFGGSIMDDTRSNEDGDAFGDFNSKEYRFERFRLAFRGLIRFVCKKLLLGGGEDGDTTTSSGRSNNAAKKQQTSSPQLKQYHPKTLVLILDDFHWIDPDSLQIIKTLMDDERKPANFLLLCATRPLDGYSHLLRLYRNMTTSIDTTDGGTSHARDSIAAAAAAAAAASSSSAFFTSQSSSASSLPPYQAAPMTQQQQRTSISSSSNYSSPRNSVVAAKQNDDSTLRIMGVPRLSVKEISDMIQTLLERTKDDGDDTDTDDIDNSISRFAEIVKSKTQGNSFVVLQFLRLLERHKHIWYCNKESKWKFDLSKIIQVDRISDNVSQVVAHHIEAGGNKRRRSALMVAASFGVSQFEVSTIVHAVSVLDQQQLLQQQRQQQQHQYAAPDINTSAPNPTITEETTSETTKSYEEYEDPYVVRRRVDEMSCELRVAAREGYVEETSPGHFRFAHDRIRESAYSLLPEGNSRMEVHLKVGRQLRSWMDTQSELGLGTSTGFSKDSLLLHATKQLNAGAELIDDDWELLDLVDLNYSAAELAAKKTAFFSSMEYLQVGLKHLGGEKAWEIRYERALRFCVALTRMQYSCGLLDECWETSEIVIRHGKNMRDKSRIYHTRVLCLMQRGLMDAALDHILEVFDLMEQPVPRKFVMLHVVSEFMKARKFLKGKSDDDLLNLPPVYDENLEIQLDFLQSLGETCIMHGKFEYVMYVALRYLNLVAERGNYPRSFFAYQLQAFCFRPNMGDLAGAQHYGKIANILSERQRIAVPGFAARSDGFFFGYVQHWNERPMRDVVEDNINAFQRLWSAGFVDTALLDASILLQHMFAAGEPIERVIKECDKYSEAFKDYQQMPSWYISASQYQALLNFQGKCDNPAILTGSLMDADTCIESWKITPNLPALYNYQFWSMVVGYHFGDFHRAKRNIKAMRGDLLEDGPTHLVPLRPFYTALVYLALFRETKQGKYRGRAMKSYKILKGWFDKGAKNFEYMVTLVEAEDASTRHRAVEESTMALYDRSIELVSNLKQTHHVALAHELAGAYLVSRGDNSRASTYLNKAIELYRTWGATAKIKDIRSLYTEAVYNVVSSA